MRNTMKSAVFRVRKQYFDDIISGKKTVEYRKLSMFWLRRLIGGKPDVAVFICGKRVHRRKIKLIDSIVTPKNFSEQGKKDIPTQLCFAIYLGEEIKRSD